MPILSSLLFYKGNVLNSYKDSSEGLALNPFYHGPLVIILWKETVHL